MPHFQGNLHVAILRAHQTGIVVGHVKAADRQSDVVGDGCQIVRRDDVANDVFDFSELSGAFLDACADLRAHVHQHLAGIDRGKEVLPEVWHEQKR